MIDRSLGSHDERIDTAGRLRPPSHGLGTVARWRRGTCRCLARCVVASLILTGATAGVASAQCSARDMDGGAPDVGRLSERASTVVRGTIVSSEALVIDRVIYTAYDLAVHETMKG